MIYKMLVLGWLLALLACSEGTDSSPEREAERKVPEVDPVETLSGVAGTLQGSWRSVDDSLHTLVFEGNLVTMGYAGTAPEEAENFVVGPTCPDAPDADPGDEHHYLSIPDAGMCYYIATLTDTTLVMSYVGRGNTLRYTR